MNYKYSKLALSQSTINVNCITVEQVEVAMEHSPYKFAPSTSAKGVLSNYGDETVVYYDGYGTILDVEEDEHILSFSEAFDSYPTLNFKL